MSKRNKKESVLDFLKNSALGDDTIKKENLVILPELKKYIFPLSKEEYSLLEKNILAEGCRDPLVLWNSNGEYILVDGHNRHSIVTRHSLDFKIVEKHFDSINDVKSWMLFNQLGRRNLTPQQATILRGMDFNVNKEQKGGYGNVSTGKNKSKVQNEPSIKDTAELLGEKHGVSRSKIKRDAQFVKGLEKLEVNNPELVEDIKADRLKVQYQDMQRLGKMDYVPKIKGIRTFLDGEQGTKESFTAQEKQGKIKFQQNKLLFHAQKLKELGLNKREIKSLIDGV